MSRSITIVSATEKEIEPLLAYLQTNATSRSTNKFTIRELQIDILYTGIGTMHTTYTLMDYLSNNTPDGWIQIGIGGALDSSLSIGDVFQINSEMISGDGAENNDGNMLSPFDLGWIAPDTFPFTNRLLLCSYDAAIKQASGMTTFYAHGKSYNIENLKKQEHGQIENMEGAPFFYISLLKNIPFLSFRSVSNYVEARDKSKWNIPLAVENLNQQIIQFLEKSNFTTEQLFVRALD